MERLNHAFDECCSLGKPGFALREAAARDWAKVDSFDPTYAAQTEYASLPQTVQWVAESDCFACNGRV